MTRFKMSIEQAAEMLREGGSMDSYHERQRTAALHDNIRDYLDAVPKDADRVLVARLEDAAASLREQLAGMVTR